MINFTKLLSESLSVKVKNYYWTRSSLILRSSPVLSLFPSTRSFTFDCLSPTMRINGCLSNIPLVGDNSAKDNHPIKQRHWLPHAKVISSSHVSQCFNLSHLPLHSNYIVRAVQQQHIMLKEADHTTLTFHLRREP